MQPWAIPALLVWCAMVVGFFWTAANLYARHVERIKNRAYDEILRDKGVTRAPGETRKKALLRARRIESMRPFQTRMAELEARRLNRQLRTSPGGFQPAGPMRPRMPSRPR